jgi:hypothetical protein
MSKHIWIRLVLPLGILSISTLFLSLYVEKPFDLPSLLINLSTDFFMIIVTVLYVDWIIKSNEQIQWRHVDDQITRRLRSIVFDYIVYLFKPVGLFEVMNSVKPNATFQMDIKACIEAANKITKNENFQSRVRHIDDEDWLYIISELNHAIDDSSKLMDMFSSRIQPEQVSLILALEMDVHHILWDREVFSVISRNDEGNPNWVYDSGWDIEWRDEYCPSIASYMIVALDKLINLSLLIQGF